MRLLSPSPGEVLDRITILNLKIKYARPMFITTAHFEEEHGALEDLLATTIGGMAEKERRWFSDKCGWGRELLLAVNGKLWALEDEVRELPDPNAVDVPQDKLLRLAQVAKLIAYFNDLRMKAVRDVNEAFGERGQEKLYKESVL